MLEIKILKTVLFNLLRDGLKAKFQWTYVLLHKFFSLSFCFRGQEWTYEPILSNQYKLEMCNNKCPEKKKTEHLLVCCFWVNSSDAKLQHSLQMDLVVRLFSRQSINNISNVQAVIRATKLDCLQLIHTTENPSPGSSLPSPPVFLFNAWLFKW